MEQVSLSLTHTYIHTLDGADERKTSSHTHTHTRLSDTHTHTHTHKHTHQLADRLTGGQTDRQTETHTDTQTHGHTEETEIDRQGKSN